MPRRLTIHQPTGGYIRLLTPTFACRSTNQPTDVPGYIRTKYGQTDFGVQGVAGLTALQRQVLADAISGTEILQPSSDMRTAYVDGTAALTLALPAGTTTGAPSEVRIASWGAGLTKAVVTAHAATASALPGLGLSTAASADPVLVLVVDRLAADGTLVTQEPLQLTVPGDWAGLAVYTYTAANTAGVDIATEGGSAICSGSLCSITSPHTSALSAHVLSGSSSSPASTATSGSPASEDSGGSPTFLFALLGLLVLPLIALPCVWARKSQGGWKSVTAPGKAPSLSFFQVPEAEAEPSAAPYSAVAYGIPVTPTATPAPGGSY